MFALTISRNTTNPDEATIERMTAGRIQIMSGGIKVATIWMDCDGGVEVMQEWCSIPGKKPGDDTPGFIYERQQES